ncbi:hypothetical protein BC332_09016 [Capsicum chinense]|nr:hypothetical protein BC332_09016 [Capsicum chinense]
MVKQDEESNDKGNKQHAKLMCMPKHIKHTYEKDQQDQDVECLQKEDFPSKEQDDELGGFTPGGVPSIDNFEEMNIVTSSKDKGKKDFEGFSSDVGTSTLDAHVEEMVNQEMEDIGTATLNALIDAVVNQNPDYSNVQNLENIHEDHSDEYLSTLSESAQLEIDAIMQGLIAPVDDIPLEVAKPVDETINLNFLFDSQISSNNPNSVVVAHLAVKIPAKRTRTRSRIFKSPYTTDFASGSKALEDERTEFKQTFAFEVVADNENVVNNIIKGFSIPVGLPWHLVDEVDKLSDTTQLLNTNPFEVEYVQNISQQDCDSLDCGVFVAGYAEYISEGMSVPTVDFEVAYQRMRYTSLLKNYDFQKVKKDYVSENEDPPRSRRTKHLIPNEMVMVRIG